MWTRFYENAGSDVAQTPYDAVFIEGDVAYACRVFRKILGIDPLHVSYGWDDEEDDFDVEGFDTLEAAMEGYEGCKVCKVHTSGKQERFEVPRKVPEKQRWSVRVTRSTAFEIHPIVASTKEEALAMGEKWVKDNVDNGEPWQGVEQGPSDFQAQDARLWGEDGK